jgi:SAM-dependent methyltransferase
MVAQATARSAALPNMQCRVADAMDLSAFADASVDAVTCCYGLMFPSDKPRALAEILRVLKPGGTLVATYWTALDVVELGRAVMGAVMGAPPPPPPPHANPLSLREAGALDALATGAGFRVAASVTSDYPFDLGTDEDMQFKMSTLLFKAQLSALEAEPHPKARAAFAANRERFTQRDAATGATVVPNNVFVMTTLVK